MGKNCSRRKFLQGLGIGAGALIVGAAVISVPQNAKGANFKAKRTGKEEEPDNIEITQECISCGVCYSEYGEACPVEAFTYTPNNQSGPDYAIDIDLCTFCGECFGSQDLCPVGAFVVEIIR